MKVPRTGTDGRSPGRVPQFDGLRALAILVVMCLHSAMPIFYRGGFWGVDVFFVLSGFLITGVLIGERQATGRVSLRRFYARRALRLYPALIALCVVLTPLALELVDTRAWSDWLGAVFLTLTYTMDLEGYVRIVPLEANPLGQMWSLAIEEQFYLLFAPAFVLMARRAVPGLGAAIGLGAVALLLYVETILTRGADSSAMVIYGRPDARFGELLAGAALAMALSARPPRGWIDRALTPASFLALVGWALAAYRVQLPWTIGWQSLAIWMPIVTVCAMVIIARLATSDRAPLSRALSWRPLTAIGIRSYGLYIWHVPLFALVTNWYPKNGSPAGHIAISWALAFAAAELSLRFVERPFLKLKDRLRTTPVAGVTASAPLAVGPAQAEDRQQERREDGLQADDRQRGGDHGEALVAQ